jgi:hypothetical protein
MTFVICAHSPNTCIRDEHCLIYYETIVMFYIVYIWAEG